MKKLLSLVVLCFLAVASSFAQEEGVPFNGIVEDVFGKPMKGVKVWVIDESWFARTDKQGHFGLTNVNANDTLHFKYKKALYAIPVAGRKAIKVKICDETSVNADEVEELADVGYGFVKRREQTTASSGISGEVLRRTGRIDLIEALQGLVPGLTVSNGKAVLRGVGTINGSTDPLYLVDGMEVNSLSYLNLGDVERVEVMKDGSMYGSRGANGVISVITRRH